ncbi:MAG: hypothetical protein Q9171_007280 [Xanthocarpia ochracea]
MLAGPPSFMQPGFNVSSFYPRNFRETLSDTYRFQSNGPYELLDVAYDVHTRIHSTSAFEVMDTTQCLHEYSQQYISSWGDMFVELSPTILYQDSTVYTNYSECQDCTKSYSSIAWVWNDSAMTWESGSGSTDGHANNDNAWLDYFSGFTTPTLLALSVPSSYPSYRWVDSESRILDQNSVVKCWAEKVPESCTLNFNLSFALVVIACNLIKLITMSLTLWLYRNPTLITTGDAINSFLTQPDEMTSGLCLFSEDSMYLHWEWRTGSSEKPQRERFRQERLDGLKSPVYKHECWLWGQSASPTRFLPTFAAGFTCFSKSTGSDSMSLAIDTSVNKTLPLHLSLYTAALLANVPQVLVSYTYITFNNILTCMLAGKEWMDFAIRRRPLRVTSPTGQQRSTYWLQLPYHYSLPLLALSSFLSWLVSQSLFVVRVLVRDKGQLLPPNFMISTCGYSPGAITLTLILSFVIVSATIATAARRYPAGMPLSATCSGAISAACHPPADDHDVAVLPVQWGVVSVKDGVGHCSFSSKLVSPPVPGRRYD